MATTWVDLNTVKTWVPGQLVEIDLPTWGISNSYVVQKVTITPQTPTQWTYRIEWGGRLLGIADFLRAIVAKEQKKRLAETTLLSKYAYGLERVGVSDELEAIFRAPPWICGDVDAICGFVVCDGG